MEESQRLGSTISMLLNALPLQSAKKTYSLVVSYPNTYSNDYQYLSDYHNDIYFFKQ